MGYLYTKPTNPPDTPFNPDYYKYAPYNTDNQYADMYDNGYLFNESYGKYAPESTIPNDVSTFSAKDKPLEVIAKDKGREGYNPLSLTKNNVAGKYLSNRDNTFLSNPNKINWDQVSVVGRALAKVGANAANVFMNKRSIESTARTAAEGIQRSSRIAQERVTPVVHPEIREVGAVKDIPVEIQLAEKNRIANIKSNYNGSDPVMRVIDATMTNDNKQRMTQEFAKNRAVQLLSERNRVSTERGNNQIAQVRARNVADAQRAKEDARIRDIKAKEAAALTDIKTQEGEAKRDLYTKAINQTVGTLDSAAAYNLTRDLEKRKSDADYYDNQIANILAMDDVGQMKMRNQLKYYITQREKLLNQASPTYGEMQAGGTKYFNFKKGGKLVPRS